MAQAKPLKRVFAENPTKICEKCGVEHPRLSRICKSCGSKKFAPSFVRKIQKVSRNFFLQITETTDEGETKSRLRLTLYKWWPGGRSTFHINTPEQWEQVKQIADVTLAPQLGWKSKTEVAEEVSQALKAEQKENKKIAKSASPASVQKFLKVVDFAKLNVDDVEDLSALIQDLARVAGEADKTFLKKLRGIVKELKKSPAQAIDDLRELLKTWSVAQITQISREVTHRIESLKLFRERVLDDRTYEIRGEDSIHRVLERAMWIIDERYWLMHSNRTLREVVGKELELEDKRFAKKRPDFVCGTVDGKLIVVELKRPSHPLTVEDLNQLETYVSLLEKNSDFTVERAFLMGRHISDELKKRMKYRGQQFKIRNYAELIDETMQRYEKYLDNPES